MTGIPHADVPPAPQGMKKGRPYPPSVMPGLIGHPVSLILVFLPRPWWERVGVRGSQNYDSGILALDRSQGQAFRKDDKGEG